MKKILKIFTGLFVFCIMAGAVSAQDITGKITDASTSEPLPGAIIKIQGTNTGTESDMNGEYTISKLKPGSYTVVYSYIGYGEKTVSGVVVEQGKPTRLDIALEIEGIETEEITVETTTSMANEQALLLEQKNSSKVQDAISEQQIKKAPDAAASDVLKRVIGVNIVGNKFVYVRGTSERYSNTTLNGVNIPSTEPDKKAFSFDLFPSNLLENITILKSYTPDLSANFSGGLVQISTKDIPESFSFSMNTGIGYGANTTGDNFLSYNAGEKKFAGINLGIDDGGRSLPSNFPNQTILSSNFTAEEMTQFGKSFRNNWGVTRNSAPLNGNFQLSVGNKYDVGGNPFGFFGSYTYRNGFSTRDVEFSDFQENSNAKIIDLQGQNSVYSVTWGVLGNLSYKAGDNNKFSLKNIYIIDGEDRTQFLEGYNNTSDLFDQKTYVTNFLERTLFSTQLSGEHYFHNLNSLRFNWVASYSDAKRNEPDFKTMTYQRYTGTGDPYEATINVSVPTRDGGGRFFSKLYDINRTVKGDFEFPVKNNFFDKFQVKLGTTVNATQREFSARVFAPAFYSSANIFEQIRIRRLGIDSVLAPENISEDKMFYQEVTRPSDSYNAHDNLYAGYLMFDALMGKFRFVAGARMEYYEQALNSYGTSTGLPVNVYKKNNDILPALTLTYLLNDASNIRAAYYQTVSRPEFREIAPFGFVDFNTRAFVIGNPETLHRSLIRNYDLRFETFPNAGEIMSVSLFYKEFDAPIEEVFLLTVGSNKTKSFMNAEKGAKNYGVEFEVRKNLGFVHKMLQDFSINANLSLINSKINLEGTGSAATDQERRLQGQSPYNVNLGLFYDNYNTGTSVNIAYNRFGDRISEVGIGSIGNVLEKGRDLLDFTATQKLMERFEVKLSIKDIFNQDVKYVQDISGVEENVRTYRGGSSYSLGVSFKY